MGDLMEMNPPEQDQRYAVYSVRNTAEDGLIYTRSFIVIKNGYGVIVRFTRLQEYAGVYVNGTYRPLTSNPEAKLYFICGMLNYCLVDHGARFGIRHVFSITREMLAEYFDHYAMEAAPGRTPPQPPERGTVYFNRDSVHGKAVIEVWRIHEGQKSRSLYGKNGGVQERKNGEAAYPGVPGDRH